MAPPETRKPLFELYDCIPGRDGWRRFEQDILDHGGETTNDNEEDTSPSKGLLNLVSCKSDSLAIYKTQHKLRGRIPSKTL